jgi:hypothetical protein
MFWLGFSSFVLFFSFVSDVNSIFFFQCKCEVIHTLHIPYSCEMVFDFVKLTVQLLLINKRKHGEQSIEVNNRKCENRQNIVFMETSIHKE